MAAFATPAELASHLQTPTVDTASATLALNIASSKIRDAVLWSISQEVGVVKTFDGRGERSLRLPTRLLTAVTSVVEDGITLTQGTDYDWTAEGRLIRADGKVWSRYVRSVVVTYTHGYATVPDTVKGICLDAAGRRYENPRALRSYTVGSVSETFAAGVDSGPVLTEHEREELAPYRLSVLG